MPHDFGDSKLTKFFSGLRAQLLTVVENKLKPFHTLREDQIDLLQIYHDLDDLVPRLPL